MLPNRVSRRKFIKNSVFAASTFAAGNILAACGLFDPSQPTPTSTSIPSPSADQQNLYVYGWATYVDNTEVFNSFTKETGIKVFGDSYDSLEVMIAKLLATGGKTGYSIIFPSDIAVAQMNDLGLLMPLDKSLLSNLVNVDPKFLDPSYDPKSAHSIPLSLGTTGIAYNVKAVQAAAGAEPTDWNFFWDHKDKIRFTLLNDIREVMGLGLHSLNYSHNATDENQIKQAYEHLLEIKPSVVAFETDAWRDRLIAGDLHLCMAYSGDGLSVARRDPNIKYILPSSGPTIWTDTMVIPKSAPNPKAAYAWINYLLKPEIAAKFINANSFGTTNKAALPQIANDLKSLPAWAPSNQVLAKGNRIVKLSPEVLRIYENYWTKLISL